jgi:K+-sensing histidine kinase KdpD
MQMLIYRLNIVAQRIVAGAGVHCSILPTLFGARLVLLGLKVRDVSTVSGKNSALSIKTGPEEVERYLATMLESFEGVEEYARTIMGASVHEVRGINRDVKSATEEILHQIREKEVDLYELTHRVNNIKGLSEILSARVDFLDYFVNPTLAQIPEDIQVHNKFYKTVQSLTTRATAKGVQVNMSGFSIGHIRGLRVFEVIPFVLIDNAIKYSPPNGVVEVKFLESIDGIHIEINNSGPALELGEEVRIFEHGTRGKNAIAVRRGFGIGLYFVKELVEKHHRGTITFEQSGGVQKLRSIPYRDCQMKLSFGRVR